MKLLHTLHNFGKKIHFPDELGLVARGARSSFVLQAMGLGLGYAVHVVLARWMGAADYGAYTYVLAWASLLAIPAGMGFPIALVRFVPEYRVGEQWGALRGMLQWSTAGVLVAGTTLAVIAIALMTWLDPAGQGRYTSLFWLGIWLIPLQALLNLIGGIYRGLHRLGLAYAIRVSRHAVMLALIVAIGTSGMGLTSVWALGASLAAALVVLFVMSGMLVSRVPEPVRTAQATYSPGAWVRVSLPLLLVGGFVLVLNQTDLVMLGALLGPRDVGLYQAASRTAALAGLIPVAIAAAADPMVARLFAEGDRARLQRLASVAVRWTTGAAVVAFLLFTGFGRLVLGVFGEAFTVSYTVLLLLAGGQVVFAGFGLAAGLLNLTGHQQHGMLIFGGTALLNVVLNAVGIMLYGRLGAAGATAVSFAVMGMALWLVAKKKVAIDASIFSAWR